MVEAPLFCKNLKDSLALWPQLESENTQESSSALGGCDNELKALPRKNGGCPDNK